MSLDPVIRLDPVLLEIFFHKFTAVAEEMAITLQRSARTTYVKEAGDFGTALASPAGRFFAYPKVLGVSGFLDSDVGPSLAAISRSRARRRHHHQPPLSSARVCRPTCRTCT